MSNPVDEMLVKYLALSEVLKSVDSRGPFCCVCETREGLRNIAPHVFACATCDAGEPAEWASVTRASGMGCDWVARPITPAVPASSAAMVSGADLTGRDSKAGFGGVPW